MAELAIRAEQLTKMYGRTRGLAGLDLAVQVGEVYGFLGPNGAGKTTTIRILLDVIRPTSGRASVFGEQPRAAGANLRRRIGYLAGDFLVDGRQNGRELLAYLGNLRGGVAMARIDELADRLALDLDRPIRSLSRGNRQKIGVVQAFMHEPELLVLDEPTNGLDPLLQQEFRTMVRQARTNGQTVFMSSHVMSEVQHTADRVGIIRDGRMIAVEEVDALLRRAIRRVEIQFSERVNARDFAALSGVGEVAVDPATGTTVHCRLSGSPDALVKEAARHTVLSLLVEEPDLEEYFLTFYAGREPNNAG